MTALIEAAVRDKVADYVLALVTVYWLIIIAYILFGWLDMFGVRIPYSRAYSAFRGFLRDASEPYLRIFRRVLPSFGGLDLSPIVGLFVLMLVGRVVASAIRGG